MYFAGLAFDAFGTLFDLSALRPRVQAAVAAHGDAVFEGLIARLVPWSWHASVARQYRPFPEIALAALHAAAQEAGVTLSEHGAAEVVRGLSALPLYPGVEQALAELAATPLAILSNGTAASLAALVAQAGLAGRFTHLLSVEAVRRFKPAPEVYHLAPAAFGAPAARILLVSGNEWDVAGARQAGLRTAWLARGRRSAPVFGLAAEIVVDDLTALPAAIRRWEATTQSSTGSPSQQNVRVQQ